MNATGLQRDIAVLRILITVFAFGLVATAVVFFFLGDRAKIEADELLTTTFRGVLFAMGLLSLPAYFVVRSGVLRNVRRAALEDRPTQDRVRIIFGHLRGLRILGAAFAEGFGLFGNVIYLITGDALALIAPAIALVVLFRLMPSEEGVQEEIESILRGESD